jgi:hypothetical protein
MSAFLLSLLLITFPASSRTSWMRPDAFHLSIGMSRMQALSELKAGGHTYKTGKNADELFVDYTDDKALTLHFRDARLYSIRFELFTFLPEVHKAFDEEMAELQKERGDPKKLASKSILVYDDAVPNVMVVMSDDPNSQNGKKGIGFVAVRYYDPK